MNIRSITVFVPVSPDIDSDQIARWGAFAALARRAYEEAGFDVQTTRLAADAFSALTGPQEARRLVEFATTLEDVCLDEGFEYIGMGPAGIDALPHLPDVFAATRAVFATAHMVDPARGVVDGAAVRGAARVVHRITPFEDGFCNLRFAALANVPPGTPFLPSAYHDGGPPAFAIATEAAGLAVDACSDARDAEGARRRLVSLIEAHAARLVDVAERLAQAHGLRFGGIDFSLAPFPTPELSVGTALEALSGRPVGAAGTLAAAAVLTDAVDRARFPHAGFCGLMLPVLEDRVLARRAAEGRLNVGELLQWSAVCGTGLDTVPLPGDASEAALARVLFDVAALSARLCKPLTARLMPLPGKVAGDPVHFDFAYFADGGVLPLDGAGEMGLLGKASALALHAKAENRTQENADEG
ncbi:MAG TPA: DUF711 family protein [Chloroflexi bacterium]|nr:DUF711 family protein [Chloroflexota bacterium]